MPDEREDHPLATAGGGHGKCWLVANGDDGNKYWMYCKKYSDDFEKDFKRKVTARAGGCRKVHRENSEPDSGTEIT